MGVLEQAQHRAKAWTDGFLAARGCSRTTRRLVFHYVAALMEQLKAMLPITLLQVLVLAIFFRQTTPSPILEAAGLVAAVIGLVLFLDGLRVAVMPMAMQIGTELPKKLHLAWVLLIAFCLGVLVTYAEPAIAAIRPLASLVDEQSAPYLYYMMNQQQEIMVLSIGIGVGVAAVIGTLKFLYNWSLKLLIYATLLPTVGAACYMQWGNPHLRPLLGVAWDCGAVTTGPVTVPVLLALGVGVMSANKQKQKMMLAVLEEAAVKKSEGNSLDGFGIVTLASLLPVLAVELLAIFTSLSHPYDYVLEQATLAAEAAKTAQLPVVDRSPVKEVVYGIRAISPLIVVLVLLNVVVIRMPLPLRGFLPEDDDDTSLASTEPSVHGSSGGGGDDNKDVQALPEAAHKQGKEDVDEEAGLPQAPPPDDGIKSPASGPPAAAVKPGSGSRGTRGLRQLSSRVVRVPSVATAVIVAAGSTDMEYYDLHVTDDDTSVTSGSSFAAEPAASAEPRHVRARAWCAANLSKYASFIAAVLMCQVGMVFFNLGLTYGFSALGDHTGITLPSSFMAVPWDPNSPYYSYAGGIVLTMLTIFGIGILATRAEPALNVLGQTVEELSHRRFTKSTLIWSVCFGVAVGMCAGASKILWQLPLIYFVLAKYAVAVALTVAAQESITAVAWDSAGVTTGPVTVPFVLAIGIGFAKAVEAPEGFGMLTVMSVAPIISVLFVSLMRKPVAKAAAGLARVSKLSLNKLSRGGRHNNTVDFAEQLRSNPALAAKAGITDAQLGRIGEHSVVVPPTHVPGSQP